MTVFSAPLQALSPLKLFAISVMPRVLSAALKGNLGPTHAEPHGDGYLDTKLF